MLSVMIKLVAISVIGLVFCLLPMRRGRSKEIRVQGTLVHGVRKADFAEGGDGTPEGRMGLMKRAWRSPCHKFGSLLKTATL